MKTTILAVATTGLLLASGAPPIEAQGLWSVEVRGGVAVSTADLVSDDLGTGIHLDGTVAYRFADHLGAYAGWDWTHFNPDDSFAGPDLDIEETGYVFGLRFDHPFSGEFGSGPALWARAGGTVDHIEIENQEGSIVGDSGHGLGWEAGAGVSLPFGGWRLTPGVRFRALSREIEIGSTKSDLDLRYITIDIGLKRVF